MGRAGIPPAALYTMGSFLLGFGPEGACSMFRVHPQSWALRGPELLPEAQAQDPARAGDCPAGLPGFAANWPCPPPADISRPREQVPGGSGVVSALCRAWPREWAGGMDENLGLLVVQLGASH